MGYGEGRRTYDSVNVEKRSAMAASFKMPWKTIFALGCPLDQYAGFTAGPEPIVKIQDIDALAVYDQTGRPLFLVADKAQPGLKLPEPSAAIKTSATSRVEYGSTLIRSSCRCAPGSKRSAAW